MEPTIQIELTQSEFDNLVDALTKARDATKAVNPNLAQMLVTAWDSVHDGASASSNFTEEEEDQTT